MNDDADSNFQTVIDEFEESDHVTKAVYELENLKHVYSGEVYNWVTAEVYDENYAQARKILDSLDTGADEPL